MRKEKQSKADPARVVGYVRASTDRQELGPQAQRDAMARWCESRGAVLVAVHEDLGVSGGAALEKRPGMLAAIDALAVHGAGTLLAAKRDRLTRDPIVGAMIEQLAARAGARVLSAAGEGTDGDDPASVLMRRMMDAFAEFERQIIRARIRSALAVKRSRGEKTGGSIPFGFALDVDGSTLTPDASEQGVIVRVRALRADGLTLRAIAARLNLDGCACRGSRWHPTTVARIVARGEAAA